MAETNQEKHRETYLAAEEALRALHPEEVAVRTDTVWRALDRLPGTPGRHVLCWGCAKGYRGTARQYIRSKAGRTAESRTKNRRTRRRGGGRLHPFPPLPTGPHALHPLGGG